MDAFEPKKLALLRILQILKTHSDYEHTLTQEDIANFLEHDYGIIIERKAISRNISLLKEAGFEIGTGRNGTYLKKRQLEDSELRLLIDGVLSSKHITARYSKDLIEKLCSLSNKYFRANINNIYTVSEWSKTSNPSLFYNIEIVDEAIEKGKRIQFDYNKYGVDKKLHRTTTHQASPYQLILHNQRYYLMALNEHWHNMSYYRLDHITNMTIADESITPINAVDGYKNGIDYKRLSNSLPYMFTDTPEKIEFIADSSIIDQIIDWFGTEVEFKEIDEDKLNVKLKASTMAMEYWAMQYINHVEVISPQKLRDKIANNLREAIKKYDT